MTKQLLKGDIVRAALTHVAMLQSQEKDFVRAGKTYKALELLHVRNDDMTNEIYLSHIYDYIINNALGAPK